MIMAASMAMGKAWKSWPATSNTSSMKAAGARPFSVDRDFRELSTMVRGGAVQDGKFPKKAPTTRTIP